MTLLPDYRAQLHRAANQRTHRSRLRTAISWRSRRIWPPLRTALAVALPVAVTALVAGAALLILHGARNSRRPLTPSRLGAQPPWLTALDDSFAVLRGPAAKPSNSIATTLLASGLRHWDLRFVRRVNLPSGVVWIAPGPSQVCVAFLPAARVGLVAAACAPIPQAVRSGVRVSTGARLHLYQVPGPRNPLRSWHAGVVPNGVTSVLIREHGRTTIRSAVRQNAFAASTSRRGAGS